jgi:hypothetical protein
MPQKNNGESGEGVSQEKPGKLFDTRLRLIFSVAGAVFGFFLSLYIFDRNPSKGLQLLTANALSLAVLVVICVQAHIYSRQRKHMEEQSKAMRDSLKIARSQVHQAYKQVDLMKGSLEIARQTMINGQRAYVTVTRGEVAFNGDNVKFALTIENSGATPANDITVRMAIEVGKYPPVPAEDIPSFIRQGSGIIGPRQEHTISSQSLKLKPQVRAHLETKSMGLCCYGMISYEDIFKEIRNTKFCFLYVPGKLDIGPCATGKKAE